MSTLSDEVESLVKKAGAAGHALESLQLSQAALNAAHALQVLAEMRRLDPEA